MAAGVILFAGWIGFSSVNVFYRDTLLEARDRRIAELSLAYDRLAADFEKSQENFVVASRDLEERYSRLYDMAMKQHTPARAGSGGVAAPSGKPTASSTAGDPAQAEAAAKPAENAAKAVAPSSQEIVDQGDEIQVAALTAEDEEQGPASIEDLEGMLRASKTPPLPGVKPYDIETRLLAVRGRQRELLDELTQRTDHSVARIEKALKLTGIDVSAMLARAAEARSDVGIGGPLRTEEQPKPKSKLVVASIGDTVDKDMAALEGQLDRWSELQALAQRLPLAIPMGEEAQVSSKFGRRKDPFTKQLAFHAGLDFIGPLRSPVLSTAPGVVVFAGRKGPYGRTVEIDHGLGIKTRYAHLRSITVQNGDIVGFGKQVGTMGSTGRSTGQHLHYEILLDDEQVDPSKFIEAGYHVFKQQENQSARR